MTLPPLILDTGVLTELARGDVVMSVVAVAAAARDSGAEPLHVIEISDPLE